MSSIDNELKSVWERLRGFHPHREDFLEEINVRNMRGIKDLRVPFNYPVTVLAGENACGKSTVLFGCAAAYEASNLSKNTNRPAGLFPSYSEGNTDPMAGIEIEYAYVNDKRRMNMIWRRGKVWNRSFLGRKGVTQPRRNVYLRTLANLTNPSEVRSMLQIKRQNPKTEQVPPEFLLLARRVLTFNYQSVHKVEKNTGAGNLLVAELADGISSYSEFHMASGERSILRLSMEISRLENALVLIDEVETGLHPYIQKLLMLNLQQMALRQQLQVIVTTHSPMVLDCVPLEGRIFLSRDQQSHDVRVEKPMRDILQKAMYGQSIDKLSVLCEDDVAEAIILGIVDALSIKMNFSPDRIFIGRDSGKDEFPHHVSTLSKVGMLSDFVFVLDGDARDIQAGMQSRAKDEKVKIIFLPGNSCPEEWIWDEIKQHHQGYEELLAIPELQKNMQAIEKEMSGTLATRGAPRFKAYLHDLSDRAQQDSAHIARTVSRHCTENGTGEIVDFATNLEDVIQKWRAGQG